MKPSSIIASIAAIMQQKQNNLAMASIFSLTRFHSTTQKLAQLDDPVFNNIMENLIIFFWYVCVFAVRTSSEEKVFELRRSRFSPQCNSDSEFPIYLYLYSKRWNEILSYCQLFNINKLLDLI